MSEMLTMTDVSLVLVSEREFTLSRWFAAPPGLLWQAFTEALVVERWLAPPSARVIRCLKDPRVGGSWRTDLKLPDGTVLNYSGVYTLVSPPDKIVYTFDLNALLKASMLEAHLFTAEGEGTRVVRRCTFSSAEDLQAIGAERLQMGLSMSYVQLDALLVELAKG
jgi:uncharacterized protein YndB with AHSA1/START domain